MNDIIIRNGSVADGTGKPLFKADIAVNGGIITKIGDLSSEKAEKELDAAGLIVAPGFIDSHAHSDSSFLNDSSCASKLYQGITTEVTGQCGYTPFPGKWPSFAAFKKEFDDKYCMAVNQAILVGHGSLREAVLGYEDRKPTEEELEKMKALLRESMDAGAWGMSLGLEYAPGFFAEADELNALGSVVKEYNGLVPCHMRSEGLNIHEAIEELLNVGRASGVHVHISHLKIDNFRVHGNADKVWQHIQDAKKEGVHITCDMYPFTASSTDLTIRCPKWSREGGNEALMKRLAGPERSAIVEHIRTTHYFNAERAETCLFHSDGGYWPEIIGKTLRFVAEEYLHTTDYAEAAADILLRTHCRAGGIFFVMSEDDMLYFLSRDIGIGSDGYALPADPEKVKFKPHPRSFAAIVEFLRLAREKQLCTPEEAVRRITSKAADMIGLTDRGRLKEGLAADITVFDPDTVAPGATYLDPIRTAVGIRHVLVNGQIALEDGVQTDVRSGRFLTKPVK